MMQGTHALASSVLYLLCAGIQLIKVLEAVVETNFIYSLNFAFPPLKILLDVHGLSPVTRTHSWHPKGISLEWIIFRARFI